MVAVSLIEWKSGWLHWLRGGRVVIVRVVVIFGAIVAAGLCAGAGRWDALHMVERGAPVALARHPGNVFLAGEEVGIELPAEVEGAASWRAMDDALVEIASGDLDGDGVAGVGSLPVGWYRVEFLNADGGAAGFTTAAVLAKLAAPTPQDSPVCVDAAMSWLAEERSEAWTAQANLAALAGVNWIRDRIHWRELEPERGAFVESTKYDASATVQTEQGLKVLQVFHTTPGWAREDSLDPERPRPDLRRVYDYCAAMARRFGGRVQAWEPWNEANAGNFGGWTIDEMCTYQKAAYLGFKAGDAEVTVCWNPMGGVNTAGQSDGILRNETWPYYDVYSIHSYDWPHDFERLWGPARAAASGRPIWVTEGDRGMAANTASEVGDYAHTDAIRKAEFMAQSYATSLFAGATRHFHFVLGYYMEQEATVQFGLLRKDGTPRPSYVALAALGRMLGGARCLGRWEYPDQPDVWVIAFRAEPDGEERDVLVGWTVGRRDWPERDVGTVPWVLPEGMAAEGSFDYLGRALEATPTELGSAPVFVVLPSGAADALPLRAVETPPYRDGDASRMVLEFASPGVAPVARRAGWTQENVRVFEPGSTTGCRVAVYNFGEETVRGALESVAPAGWDVAIEPATVEVEAGARVIVSLDVTPSMAPLEGDDYLVIRGEFGAAGKAVVAVQVAPEAGEE